MLTSVWVAAYNPDRRFGPGIACSEVIDRQLPLLTCIVRRDELVAKPVVVLHEPLYRDLLSGWRGVVLIVYALGCARCNLHVSPPYCRCAIRELIGASEIHDWYVIRMVLISKRTVATVIVAAD